MRSVLLLSCLVGCLDDPCVVEPDGAPCKPNHAVREAPTAPPVPNCPLATDGELLINEVLPDPGGLDVNGDGEASAFDDEFVELVSTADGPRSFRGVTLRVGETARLVLDDRCVGAGRAVVVFGGGQVPPATPEVLALVSRLSLSNAGGELSLEGPDGSRWDSVSWGGATPRESLTRVPDLSGDFGPHPSVTGSLLRASPGLCANLSPLGHCETQVGGPDTPPCQAVEYGELVINEILADPGGLDVNGDGVGDAKGDEFLELMVLSTGPRRLENVRVVVNDQERATLNTGCLSPGQSVVVVGSAPAIPSVWGDPSLVADRPLGLANVGATIELWTDLEALERLRYSEIGPRVTLRRKPDGVGDFSIGVPTPGECSIGGPLALGCERR